VAVGNNIRRERCLAGKKGTDTFSGRGVLAEGGVRMSLLGG